jgi:hypothetical protein
MSVAGRFQQVAAHPRGADYARRKKSKFVSMTVLLMMKQDGFDGLGQLNGVIFQEGHYMIILLLD